MRHFVFAETIRGSKSNSHGNLMSHSPFQEMVMIASCDDSLAITLQQDCKL